MAAVLGAGLRLASVATTRGLERVVAGTTIGVALIVLESLALGLFGLTRYPAAICALAAATWLLAWRLIPVSREPALDQAARVWRGLSRRGRACTGALLGAGAVWVLWPLHSPTVGYDGISYHMPEILGWVATGHPGAIHDVSYFLPFPNYPITNEVALTWLTSVSRGFAVAAVWTPLLHLLLAAAGWLGLRTLGVPRLHAGLAVAAFCLMPLTVLQVNAPSTDLAGATWCVCAAGLAAAAVRNPRLMPFSVVAAGLAIGTKTSTGPLTAIALGAALFAVRGSLRGLTRLLIVALLVAVAVGGVWYLRNLIDHGSPLYPFVHTPGGDQPPLVWRLLDHSFIERPGATLRGRENLYADLLGGGLVVLVSAIAMPFLAWSRRVWLAAAAAVVAVLLWMKAPSTGVSDVAVLTPNVAGTTRYALPALAGVALVPALAATVGRRAALVSGAALAVAVGWDLWRLAVIGQPQVPSVGWLALAAGGGAAVCAAGKTLGTGGRYAAAQVAAAAVVVGLVLGQQADSYVERLTPNSSFFPSASVVSWFISRPGFQDNHRPIAIAGQLVSALAGDHLEHRVTLVPQHESCAAIRARASKGWVVVVDDRLLQSLVHVPGINCFGGVTPTYSTGAARVFGSGGS